MLGAIIGDIVGSVYEWHNIKTKDFELFSPRGFFTDDSVMTLAVADAILEGGQPENFTAAMREYGALYPNAGYGGRFSGWLESETPRPYNSFGNGSAMRVSPCAWASDTLDEALTLAQASTAVTHDHPEGIKGAQAVAAAIFLAREKWSREYIKSHIEQYYYRLDFTIASIRESYSYDVTCQGSVPQALQAFFESDGFEDAVRNAVSIGGDSDTIAAITGSVAEAYYGIDESIKKRAMSYLDAPLLAVLHRWDERYGA